MTALEPRSHNLRVTLGLLLALTAASLPGCTYSSGKQQGDNRYQGSTADPYTYEFERRTPPGGD